MKNRNFIFIFISFVCFCLSLSTPAYVFAAPPQISSVGATSYIVMDYETGTVLAASQADQPKPPASMTKMMTQFVILDQIKQGKLQWDEMVTVSPRAAAIDEAQIQLIANEKMNVRELFIAMSVQSANDATVVLAERVAGSEESFVKMMNQKAKQLGMKNTHFWNSTGLNKGSYPDPPGGNEKHVMSARDTAILVSQLIKAHPDIIKFTSMPKYTFFKGTPRERQYDNWNQMLPGLDKYYQGVDGFKTGFTNAAGYCFTGTAKRGPFRLLTVVMGTKSQGARFTETQKLLNHGFDQYEVKTLIPAQHSVPHHGHLMLPNGVEKSVPVVVKEQIRLPVNKKEAYTYQVTFKKGLKAPVPKGAVVGEVKLLDRGQELEGFSPIPLVTYTAVEEGSWLRLLFRGWGERLQVLF